MTRSEYQKQWYKANRERILVARRQYRRDHQEYILAYRKSIPEEKRIEYRATAQAKGGKQEYMRAYRQLNRAKLRSQQAIYTRNRSAVDVNYKLAARLRKRLLRALESDAKTGSAVRDLGCSVAELRVYLETRFKPGMTWENWGLHGWHIDHIKPLIKFDLTDRKQFLEACHYTNLQPLWAIENIRKNDHV